MSLNVKNLIFRKMYNFMDACCFAFSNSHLFWKTKNFLWCISKVTLLLFLCLFQRSYIYNKKIFLDQMNVEFKIVKSLLKHKKLYG